MDIVDVDSIYRRLGTPGCYQLIIYFLLCPNYFCIVMNHMAMAFFGSIPDHMCSTPERNGSWFNRSGPVDESTGEPSSCLVYTDATSNLTETCPDGWQYDVSNNEHTIVSDFDLVCEKEYLTNIATTVYFCGVMFGGLVFGGLSDRFGRKPFMLLTLYCYVLTSVLVSLSPNYVTFVLLRCLVGFFMQGLQICTFVLIMELFTPEHRTAAGTVIEIFWAGGVILLPLISMFLRNWRYIQLAISLPYVLGISFIWIIPESVRWLLTQKKYDRAKTIIQRIAKFNKRNIPEDVKLITSDSVLLQNGTEDHASGENLKKREYTPSVLDMFKNKVLFKRSVILFYIWGAVAIGYYGLTQSITTLPGNKYINMMISGCVEMPAYALAVFILRRFGRKRPLCFYLITGGIMSIAAGLVPSPTESDGYIGWPTTLAIVGRFGMAGCFSVILLYTSELYPTVIRNVSIGACAFFNRLGGVLAPQVLLLGRHTWAPLPVLLFGSMALLGGCLACMLPETLNTKLPDTIEEAVNLRPATPVSGGQRSRLTSEDKDEQDIAPTAV